MNKKILPINSYIFLSSQFRPRINGDKVSYYGQVVNVKDNSIKQIDSKEIKIEKYVYLKIQYTENFIVESIKVIGGSKINEEKSIASDIDLVVFLPLSIFSKSDNGWFLKKQMIFNKIFNNIERNYRKFYCKMSLSIGGGNVYVNKFEYEEIPSKAFSLQANTSNDLNISIDAGEEISHSSFSDNLIKIAMVIKDDEFQNRFLFRSVKAKNPASHDYPKYVQKFSVSKRWWKDIRGNTDLDEQSGDEGSVILPPQVKVKTPEIKFEIVKYLLQ